MTGARWIALGSLAVLAAGLAAAYLHGRVPRPAAPVAAAPETLVVEPPEGVEIAVEQAFKQLPGGEERAERMRWVGEVPGLASTTSPRSAARSSCASPTPSAARAAAATRSPAAASTTRRATPACR